MTANTKRRARRQAAPQAAASTEPEKKCVLCQNTNAGELEDFGEGGDVEDYWMCVDVGPCIERAWAARPSAADGTAESKPETETAPAEDAEATS